MKPTMARSDSEDVYEVTDGGTPGALLAKLQDIAVDNALLDKRNDATIHSGHFMVSHVHDDEPPDEVVVAEEADADATLRHGDQPPPPRGGIVDDVETVLPSPVGWQSPYGSAALVPGGACGLLIDGSLRKLFECMSLAHCNKLTSPKWKNFKGVNVRLKDKIRLNNIIWREWHMQYIKGISPIVCHFESAISSKSDDTIDYWKLRLNSLTRDYKQLSRFLARRFSAQPDDHELLTRVLPPSYYELLQRVSHSNTPKMTSPSLITVPMFSPGSNITRDDEIMINDLLDTLFTPPYTSSSSSRGNSSNFNSQMSLEEFMDTLEPLPPPLAVDFRGFGRLSSSVSGVGASGVTGASMTLPIAPIGFCNAVPAMQPPEQQLPAISSQTLSFGSAEELFALLQSQLTSESSLEHLIGVPSSAVDCSGYAGTNIQPGFAIPDDNLVASDAAGISLLSANGIEIQEYPSDSASQLCSMFFLPEDRSHPAQSMSLFARVDETPKTNATTSSPLSLQFDPAVESKLQVQDFIQNAMGIAASEQSKLSHPGSSSLPRLKSSHDLEMVHRGSKSLGSLQTNDDARSLSNSKSSNESQSRQALKRFRTPQNTGPRHLPQLQPRPQNTCSAAYQQVTHARPDMSLIITKQPMKPTVSTGDWSIVMSTGANQLTIPILNQFAVGQDIQTSSKNAAQGGRSAETRRRVRHKSDQSSAAKGTTIRPIAVFQPINPLQTASNTGRTSSKTNCSVSFSLDKNTTISPAPVFDPSMFQVHDLSNSIILSTPGNSVAFAAPSLAYDEAQNGAFGEIRSCPGIFETSFHPSDFSQDSVSLNSSSARSRHTSNESNRSTSSHYDDFGANQKGEARKQSKEHRRVSHITAEQKRRCNIKYGFDTLVGLIPDLKDSSNSRVSKAVALHKAADLCKKMKQERKDELQEMEQLRNEIKALEANISACQSKLPDTGAPPIKQPVEQLNELYDEYFFKRTLENWKFFIFGSVIARPLIKSFDEEVTHGSFDQLQKSVQSWIQTHCSLASLRPRVTNALVDLSKQTSILSNPSLVAEEVKRSVLHHQNSLR